MNTLAEPGERRCADCAVAFNASQGSISNEPEELRSRSKFPPLTDFGGSEATG
jgi:hypothetical protein